MIEVAWPLNTFEIDDYPWRRAEVLATLDGIKERFPGFRATLFAIPAEMTEADWQEIDRRREWVEVGLHGFTHRRGEWRTPEMYQGRDARRILAEVQADERWARIAKAPWYGYDAGMMQELHERGFAFAVKSLQGVPFPTPRWRIWSMYDAAWRQRVKVQRRNVESHPYSDNPRLFKSNKTALNAELVEEAARFWGPDDEWSFVSRCAQPAPRKLNLGCERQILPGWHCLDNRAAQLGPGVIQCDLRTEMLPFAPYRVDVVNMSHMLEYIEPEFYADLLLEVWRVLRPGGLVRISDNDADGGYRWRPIGASARGTGTIRSHPSRSAVRAALEQVGFEVHDSAPGETRSPHRDILHADNRTGRFRSGQKFILEGVKRIAVPNINRRIYLHDPRAQRRMLTRWRMQPAVAAPVPADVVEPELESDDAE